MTDTIKQLKRRAEAVNHELCFDSRSKPRMLYLFPPVQKSWELSASYKTPELQVLALQAAEDIIAAEEKRQECPRCEGRKGSHMHPNWSSATHEEYTPCPTCTGTGKRKEDSDEPEQK